MWQDGTPFWAMNYAGRVTGRGFSGDFLKEALLLGTESLPFRGPALYESGGFTYKCAVNGGFEWFSGFETISAVGEKIYECLFHGGSIV